MAEKKIVTAAEIGGGLTYPLNVLYAGTSPRRRDFLEHAFHRAHVGNSGIGPEPSASPEDVMRYKLQVGLGAVPVGFNGAVIAADTQTAVSAVERGTAIMVSRGKPHDPTELFSSFVGMKDASKLTHEPPFYQVNSASGLIHISGGKQTQVEDKLNCTVILGPGAVTLATEQGFQTYLKQFADFYSEPPYSTRDMALMTPANLSGGISLPVLLRMGLVQSVGGVDVGSPDIFNALIRNVHTVAIGISPGILESVRVDPKRAINNWAWLTSVVDHALSK